MGLVIFAQTIPVSHSVEKKNAILELFSGINCQYCPLGDKKAEELAETYPGDFLIVDIQGGTYANPSAGQPDYRTPFGDDLINQSGLNGYPAGSINRHVFPGLSMNGNSIAMSVPDWTNATNQIFAQNSPVNIGVEATINVQTMELNVHVQVYYTGSSASLSNWLNVGILQDNLIGPQVIASGVVPDPDLITPEGDYIHNNMLRHFLTGQWGTELEFVAPGKTYDKTYTYTLGDSIYEIPVVLGDLEILVFVSEGHKEILTGHVVKPTFVFPNSYDANLTDVTLDAPLCGFTGKPVVAIQNFGSQPLSSLDFAYSINGSPVKNYHWTGLINSIEKAEFQLEGINFFPSDTNELSLSISQPNGQADQNTLNDQRTIQFLSALDVSNTVTMVLQLDRWGAEVSWEVRNSSDSILYSGGPYTNTPSGQPLPSPLNQTFTLASGDCYRFIAYDSYGDGIPGTNTGFLLRDDNFLTIVSKFADYGKKGVVQFGIDAPQPDSSDVFPPTTGILSLNSSNNEILIYPNPTSSSINVDLISLDVYALDVYVVNSLGQEVIVQRRVSNEKLQLNVADLQSGVYFLNVIAGEKRYTGKVLVGF